LPRVNATITSKGHGGGHAYVSSLLSRRFSRCHGLGVLRALERWARLRTEVATEQPLRLLGDHDEQVRAHTQELWVQGWTTE